MDRSQDIVGHLVRGSILEPLNATKKIKKLVTNSDKGRGIHREIEAEDEGLRESPFSYNRERLSSAAQRSGKI